MVNTLPSYGGFTSHSQARHALVFTDFTESSRSLLTIWYVENRKGPVYLPCSTGCHLGNKEEKVAGQPCVLYLPLPYIVHQVSLVQKARKRH